MRANGETINTTATESNKYADGSKYEGLFVDNKPYGEGKLILPDGTVQKVK